MPGIVATRSCYLGNAPNASYGLKIQCISTYTVPSSIQEALAKKMQPNRAKISDVALLALACATGGRPAVSRAYHLLWFIGPVAGRSP
jgi:hypothetical protein